MRLKVIYLFLSFIYIYSPHITYAKDITDKAPKVILTNNLTFSKGSKHINLNLYSIANTSLNFIKLNYKYKSYTLPKLVSADGARFTDDRDLTVWLVGDKLRVINNLQKHDSEPVYHLDSKK